MTEIHACPNPECGEACHIHFGSQSGIYVMCHECGYTGPDVSYSEKKDEQKAANRAIRLHNLICERTPPAASAPAAPVAWIRAHKYCDFPTGESEYDEELRGGPNKPDGEGWSPLFAAPPAPTLEGIANAAKEIFDLICAFNRDEVEVISRKQLVDILTQHITPMQATEKEGEE